MAIRFFFTEQEITILQEGVEMVSGYHAPELSDKQQEQIATLENKLKLMLEILQKKQVPVEV